jgi:hypothetical protein
MDESSIKRVEEAASMRSAIESLQSHPMFHAAVVSSMRGTIELHQGRGLANWVLNDRARALLGHCLIYLHATGRPDDPKSGLTAVRVKAFVADADICSPGRAAAMLALMRMAGYLQRMPGATDRRFRRLAPTEKLIALHRDRLRCQFEALAPMLPEAKSTAQRLGDPDFERVFWRAMGDRFLSGARLLSYAPDLAPFAENSAGMMVLFGLMLSADDRDTFGCGEPIAISISGSAARFRVSRAQVLRLLREAERRGYLKREKADQEHVVLEPKLRHDMLAMLAAIFAFLSGVAKDATAAIERAA